MVNSAGKMLREARLKKNIPIQEASHATKIRPDRLADLENDDYTRFASMAYAKGFLIIYSKYLRVDVSEFLTAMGVGNPVGTADYDYLSNSTTTYEPATWRDRPPKKPNYKALATVVVTVICMFWVMQFVDKIKRIGSTDKLIERKNQPEAIAAPQTSPAPPVSAPTPVVAPTPSTDKYSMAPSIAAIPLSSPEPAIEIRRAEPVVESAPEQPAPLTPSTTSTDAKTERPRKSRTH